MRDKNKRAQVTIFIIIAIVIVAGILAYFALSGKIGSRALPKELSPAYNYFLSCIQEETQNAVLIMGSQGGYIEVPEFSPGSEYMPFSSQLDFLGTPVPYWYYISGNGVAKEQVPSKEKMETQIEDYLKENIALCNFASFEEQGFGINISEEIEADAKIQDNKVDVTVNMPLSISFGEIFTLQNKHKTSVNSRLGKFYNIAKKIYDKEQQDMFLENYGIDVLRLYAPVDGSEIGCSPKIWLFDDVRKDLMDALAINVPATKVKGDYYTLGKEENKYFIQDLGEKVDVDVNFMYVKNWPLKLEAWPSEEGILKAEPVGLQEGLGMLGFCYVPYHFVYDFAYPVLIQIYDSNEMFQFPVAVVIDKNMPRKALDVEGLPDVIPELCQHKNQEMEVYTYNTNLEPVEAQIKFKCFDTTCSIGATEMNEAGDAYLSALFPECVNGYIVASAEGYKTKKYLASTVESSIADIILDKKYNLSLEVQKQGTSLGNEFAVITFNKDGEVLTLAYPEQKEVSLTEGQYEIKVYVYTTSNINLQGSSSEKCVDVPKSGLLGIFGMTEEKCFTMQVPEQIVSFAVSGGGTQKYYIGESELQDSSKLIINAEGFGVPTKVEDIQINYNSVETSGLDVVFE